MPLQGAASPPGWAAPLPKAGAAPQHRPSPSPVTHCIPKGTGYLRNHPIPPKNGASPPDMVPHPKRRTRTPAALPGSHPAGGCPEPPQECPQGAPAPQVPQLTPQPNWGPPQGQTRLRGCHLCHRLGLRVSLPGPGLPVPGGSGWLSGCVPSERPECPLSCHRRRGVFLAAVRAEGMSPTPPLCPPPLVEG